MSKLRLDLDALQVESFDTRPGASRPRGTVQGHGRDTDLAACGDATFPVSCWDDSCAGSCASCDGSCVAGTCAASCNGTCAVSCNGTCLASCGGTCDATCVSCGYSCDASCVSCWGSQSPMECCA